MMWRSFYSTPSLLLLPDVHACIKAVSMPCISVVGHFEISKKSNNVGTRGRRVAKFSHNVGLKVVTRCTRNGVAAMLGVAARWR